MSKGRNPKHYKVNVSGVATTPSLKIVNTDCWVYTNPRSRDVYVMIALDDGRHATVSVRLPTP